jgi:hypothetical protein
MTALGTGTIGGTLNILYVGPAIPFRSLVDLVLATTLVGAFATATVPASQGNQQFVVQPTSGAVQLRATSSADLDADGHLNSADFFAFLAQFFATGYDFNHDGVSNSRDFFDFLAIFFAGERHALS